MDRIMNAATWRMASLALMVLATTLLLPGEAKAQSWNFDTCDATEITEVELSPPAAMLMLDRSGSMGWGQAQYCCWEQCSIFSIFGLCIGSWNTVCGYNASRCGSVTLWDVALAALNVAVGALEDEMEFGLGFFPRTHSNVGAYIATEALLFARPTIMSLLNASWPAGGTPTNEAVNVTRNSETMQRQHQATAGVIITDGIPNNRTTALQESCVSKAAGQTTYVVGLGHGTDVDFNNKMAAAAGTGCCGSGANNNCTNGLGVDPCVNPNVQASTCYGSIQAYNQTEFQGALLAISGELACTFPVDTSLYPGGDGPEDPEALRVRLTGAIGTNVTIPHRSQASNNEGWYYPNTSNRNQIALTSHYCQQVANKLVDVVETRLACPCSMPVGEECEVVDPEAGVCPFGSWSCDNGFDVCQPYSATQCPIPCFGAPLGERCRVTGAAPAPYAEGHIDLSWEDELNRCRVGEVLCVDNVNVVCESLFRPMPEICNGLDNSCDGKIGNISETWSSTAFEDYEIPASFEYPMAHCGKRDACFCPAGRRGEHAGQGATAADEFEAYLNAYEPVCECTQALE